MSKLQLKLMPAGRRWLALGGGVALLVIALVAPIGSAASVAQVGGQAITFNEYRDWLGAAAVSAHSSDHSLPPFPPDAPSYGRCVAFEQRATAAGKSRPSARTLRGACRLLLLEESESTVGTLISSQWIIDQGQREHVRVTAAAMQSAMHKSFAKSGTLARFLAQNGLTRVQLDRELRAELIAQRLSALHKKSSSSYLQSVQRYWKQRTTCTRGYRLSTYCSNG
jgi:hypothetical protein